MRQSVRGPSKRVAALVSMIVLLGVGLVAPRTARADESVSKQLRAKVKKAMESFDSFEYEEARQTLNSAVLLAKKKHADKDPELAQVQLALGIVYFAGFQEADSAKLAFMEAVQIDPSVEIGEGYKTKEMEDLLDSVKADIGASGGGGTDTGDTTDTGSTGGGDDVNCDSIEGIEHHMVDEAPAGKDTEISAYVAPSLSADKVVLFYRPKGATNFSEVKMKASGTCKFTGTIPGKALSDEFVHYYISAVGSDGKALASRGSAGLPNIIEVAGSASGDDDSTEDPLHVDKKKTEPGATKPARVFLSIAAGSGGGYVSGNTEQVGTPVQCCFAPALLHLFPEVGYYFSPQTSIAVAFRMGFPIGANRHNHATAAPAGFIRLRHAISPSGEGVHITGALGAGVIRHTIQLTDADMSNGDVDTSASGPLFVGTGAGYTKSLGGPVRFLVELNALIGIPAFKLGSIDTGFTVQLDANLGLIFAF